MLMNPRALILLIGLVTALGLTGPAQAQDPSPKPTSPKEVKPVDISAFFPIDKGRRWTYRLKITIGKKSKSIEYTTKVVRKEKLKGIGECAVFESRSDRLLVTEWYYLDPEKGLSNPKRLEGKRTALFQDRIILSPAALAAAAKKAKFKPLVWKSKDGSAHGTTHIVGRETIRNQTYGKLECLVVMDRGTYTFSKGKVVRVQERKLYFSEDVGLVREFMQVKKPDGKVTMETLAELKHHDG
jgi:hypothetical protein